MAQYAHLRPAPGVDLAHEQPGFLAALDRVGATLGVTLDVFSGARTSGSGRWKGVGFAGDPHDYRTRPGGAYAADVNVNGKPLGDYPGAVAAIHQAGLRSGATDFSYQGKPDPAHVDAVTPTGKPGSSTASPEAPPPSPAFQEILRRSLEDNLDPAAVAAIASVEGGFTKRPGTYDPDTHGAPGWSYGPFQLRSPGALPVASAGANGPGVDYAWSNAGIDYAVDQIGKVAAGKKGPDAIAAIVTGFEHPANPSAETARAQKAYDFYAKGGTGSYPLTPTGPGSTNPGGLIGGTASAIDSVSNLLGVIFSARGLEMGAGFLLVIVGVAWLAKKSGVPTSLAGAAAA